MYTNDICCWMCVNNMRKWEIHCDYAHVQMDETTAFLLLLFLLLHGPGNEATGTYTCTLHVPLLKAQKHMLLTLLYIVQGCKYGIK